MPDDTDDYLADLWLLLGCGDPVHEADDPAKTATVAELSGTAYGRRDRFDKAQRPSERRPTRVIFDPAPGETVPWLKPRRTC